MNSAWELRSRNGWTLKEMSERCGIPFSTLSKIEHAMIKAALHEHHGKVDAAAHALGISRKGLYLKRQRLGL